VCFFVKGKFVKIVFAHITVVLINAKFYKYMTKIMGEIGV